MCILNHMPPQHGASRRRRRSRTRLAATTAAVVSGLGGTAHAEGLTVVPSVTIAGVYDDNLFLTSPSTARSGLGLRVGPGLSWRYQPNARLLLDGRADVLGEYFGDPVVNRLAANRSAVANAHLRLGEKTGASVSAQYVYTSDPGELVRLAGLSYGRRAAEGMGIAVGLERRFAPKFTLRLGYHLNLMRLQRDRLGSASELASDTSFVFRVGPATRVTFTVGPRYFDGSWNPRGGVTAEHSRERARFSLTYDRGRSVVYDRALLIETYSGRFSYRLSRDTSVELSPGLYRYWEFENERRAWRLSSQVSRRLGRAVQAYVSYDHALQDSRLLDDLRTRRSDRQALARNVVVAGLRLTPWRHEETRQEEAAR